MKNDAKQEAVQKVAALIKSMIEEINKFAPVAQLDRALAFELIIQTTSFRINKFHS